VRRLLLIATSLTLAAVGAAAMPTRAWAQDPAEIRRTVRSIIDRHVSADMRREIAIVRELQGTGNQRRDTRYPFEQQDRETRTIALGPNGSLELRNLSGRITVTGGSGRDVTIEISRQARGRTEADAARGLKEVTTQVSHSGSRASVETRYPEQDRNRQDYSVNVSYDVTAPAGTSLTIHNLSGDVTIKSISGEISVDVASGDIGISQAARIGLIKALSGDLTLTDIKSTSGLDAGTMSGDIRVDRVQVPRITVTTISGDVIATAVTADSASMKTTSGSVGYTGTLTKTGKYDLQSHSGDVTLTVIGSGGFDLTARTFSGRVQPDPGLGLKVTERREVRGVVGDGGAAVQATTFSGNVIIVRK
jgi:hypothetical protein